MRISKLKHRFQSDYQPERVKSFLEQLGHLPAGGCTEIRILPRQPHLRINDLREYVGRAVSGYFTDYQKAAKEIREFDGLAAVYCTLQPCEERLLRRSNNRLTYNAKHTTNDSQIVGYRWILIDIDPERPAGTASSDHELQLSADLLNKIERELLSPLEVPLRKGVSGNGVHGLIPIESHIPVAETQTLVREILEELAAQFNQEQVKVDTSVFNPSRVTKVFGTMAIKGDNTEAAPHRRSLWLSPSLDDRFSPYDIRQLHQSVCSASAKKGAPKTTVTTQPTDNTLETLLSRHDLAVAHVKEKDGARYLTLEECPFNPDHRQDAAVIEGTNGRIGFKCFHASCQGKGWPQVKTKIGISDQPARLPPLTAESNSLAVPLPTIIVNNRSLATVTQESLQAIQNSNQDQPAIFHMNNELLRVVPGAEGDHKIELLTRDSLKGVMTRTANFVNQSQKGEKHRFPPSEVAADILSLPTYFFDSFTERHLASSSGPPRWEY